MLILRRCGAVINIALNAGSKVTAIAARPTAKRGSAISKKILGDIPATLPHIGTRSSAILRSQPLPRRQPKLSVSSWKPFASFWRYLVNCGMAIAFFLGMMPPDLREKESLRQRVSAGLASMGLGALDDGRTRGQSYRTSSKT